MPIIRQELTTDHEGNIRLRNICSAQDALDMARVSRETNNTGYFGDKNGECKILGYIPEEMFTFNPWLICATRAKREGDMGKYNYYMMKFFELFPAFQGTHKTRYWRGHRAVLL